MTDSMFYIYCSYLLLSLTFFVHFAVSDEELRLPLDDNMGAPVNNAVPVNNVVPVNIAVPADPKLTGIASSQGTITTPSLAKRRPAACKPFSKLKKKGFLTCFIQVTH